MVRRTSRSDVPSDVSGVLRGLAACRDLILDVRRQVKPTGACYYGAGMVLAAIDGFAAFLTGQRYYLATLESRGFMGAESVDPDEIYDQPRREIGMTPKPTPQFRAILSQDGAKGNLAETEVDAASREAATSKALEWAVGNMPTGISAPTSLYLSVDGQDWLIKRWGDL